MLSERYPVAQKIEAALVLVVKIAAHRAVEGLGDDLRVSTNKIWRGLGHLLP